jgi:hypothetical protein
MYNNIITIKKIMNLEKIKKDVLEVFDSEIKSVYEIKKEEVSKYSYILNGLIKDILNSYYFENKYKVELIRTKNENGFLNLIQININGRNKLDGIFKENLDENNKFQTINGYKVSDEYNLIISKLKEIKEYKIIFEKDIIKRSLNLKEKNIINIETINYKKNPDKIISLIGLKNEKDLENHLAEIDLDLLLPLAKESDYITVAHSEKEIIGFATIQNSNYINSSKIKSINYIKVREDFRKQNVATRIFKEIKNKAKLNNNIIEIDSVRRIPNIDLNNDIFADTLLMKGSKFENRNIINTVINKVEDWNKAFEIIKLINEDNLKEREKIKILIDEKLNKNMNLSSKETPKEVSIIKSFMKKLF